MESNREILGGKPVITGTRIPVVLIYELRGLSYTIDEIQKGYPHLNRQILLKVIELGDDALINLL